MLKAYSAFLDKIDKVLFVVLTILGSGMTLIMLYQVALRYIFNASNIWAEELVRYMFVWTAMLGASVAIRKNSHLQIDFVVNALRLRSRLILQIASYILVLIFLLYLFELSVELVGSSTMHYSGAMYFIPMAVPYSCMPIGSFLMILTCVEFLCKKVREYRQLFASSGEGGEGAI